MSYTLSGAGFLGQASGSGPKVITIQQVAQALIKKILDFKIPLINVSISSAIPGSSIESILTNIAASKLQSEFADALDISKAEEAHTDMIGFMLATEAANLLYQGGFFTDDPADTMMCKGTGLVWIAMVGDNWQSPGELAKFISNKLEDVVTELTGVEATAPPPTGFDFGGGGTTTPTAPGTLPQIQVAAWQQYEAIAPQLIGQDIEWQVGAKGTRVPTGGLPIIPLAIAGIAALLILRKD